MTSLEQGRREELAAALARVRRRITTACAAAGRDPAEVRLLPVTKTFPARDVALLVDQARKHPRSQGDQPHQRDEVSRKAEHS